jgi:hypothetical protein
VPGKPLDFGGCQNGKWPVLDSYENEYFFLTV